MKKSEFYISAFILTFIILIFILYVRKVEAENLQEKTTHQKQQEATTEEGSNDKPDKFKISKERVQGYLRLADGSKWPLLFEDGEYSKELIEEIVADINLVYSRFEKHQMSPEYYSKKFKIEGRDIKSESYFDITMNKGYYRPDPLAENFGFMVELDGKQHIIISKILIKEYEKALRFKNEHKEVFNKLITFLEYINELKDASHLSDDEVQELFYVYSYGTNVLSLDIVRKNAKEIPFCRIRYPSLLEFSMINDGKNNLICGKTILFKKETGKALYEINLCYSDQKWHIMPAIM